MSPSGVPLLAYSTGDFPTGATSFVRTDADGKRYKIRSSSAVGNHHAMALFTGNNYHAFWQPANTGGESVFYRNFDGQNQQVPGGAQWVEIKLPAKYILTEYTLHHNMMTDGTYQGPQNSNVPTAWMVLGSTNRTNWTLLHMDNRGVNAWRNEKNEGFTEIQDGMVKGVTSDPTPFQYFRFVFTSWNKGNDTPRLDRIRMMISGGTAGTDGDDMDDDAAPSTPSGSAPMEDDEKEENKIQEFIEEYKWYLLAAAIAILVAVIMYS